MWTPKTRAEHDRDDLRYPSDLTDAEWQILAPLLPPPADTRNSRARRAVFSISTSAVGAALHWGRVRVGISRCDVSTDATHPG